MMNHQLNIRLKTATPSDRAALLIWMQTELADQFNRINQVMGINQEQFVEIYKSTGEVRVILKEHETTGYAWIEERTNELHIHALFILPAFRRKGVGSAFFRELESEFNSKVDFFELGVEMNNENAIALYRKRGFVEVKEIAELGYLVMQKPIYRESQINI